VKKSTSKINYSFEVVISNAGDREDDTHGRSLADDLSSSTSASRLNLNNGHIALSAPPDKADDYDYDYDNCIRSEQGAKTLESPNHARERKRRDGSPTSIAPNGHFEE
jgi:hypothetical protein